MERDRERERDVLGFSFESEGADSKENLEMRRLRSSSATPSVVASTSGEREKRRKRNERTTGDEDVVKQIKQQQEEEKKKNSKAGLPDELWAKILEDVDDNSVMAFASVSKQLRRVQKESERKLELDLRDWENSVDFTYHHYYSVHEMLQKAPPLSEEWCLWTMIFLSDGRQQELSRQITNAVAFWGHLGALKRWKEQGREQESLFDENTCEFAALGGQLEVLKYLHEKGCPWNEGTCANAAEGGHLEVLKYAHENGCPLHEATCQYAAKEGHLDVLKYAHKNGCAWGVET